MLYKYAQKTNYEYLSAGMVIKSYKGNTNFPVRLGNEIFHRCLSHINKNENISIYDPMCGSGYLLTILCALNFSKIDRIYGSDIDSKVLIVANQNLRLLTKVGINERELELKKHLTEYNRPSYRKSLDYSKIFVKTISRDLKFELFNQDVFEEDYELGFSTDLIIMDLPYNKIVNYEGVYTKTKLVSRLKYFTEKASIVAVIRNKEQNLKFGSDLIRCEKIKAGKRIIEIFKKGKG